MYIHTAKNVLIEVNPQTRIPRTFKRFAGLIVQLLHKFSVKAADSSGLVNKTSFIILYFLKLTCVLVSKSNGIMLRSRSVRGTVILSKSLSLKQNER